MPEPISDEGLARLTQSLANRRAMTDPPLLLIGEETVAALVARIEALQAELAKR